MVSEVIADGAKGNFDNYSIQSKKNIVDLVIKSGDFKAAKQLSLSSNNSI